MDLIPVILFAYTSSDHLRQTLDCLRANQVPVIYAFSDGPRTPDKASAVAQVRDLLRGIDWCEVVIRERDLNLGLGRSILTGVTEVLDKHDAAIIFEDDLVCVPGTYEYLCASLDYYRDDPRVMTVTGWTHPLVKPTSITDQPYFDGRAECWVWGTWTRAWQGMREDAKTMLQRCEGERINAYRYGADLPAMAEVELQKNIWAVRFLYWHIVNRGLCLRPPWSMVEHIGFDATATNASSVSWMKNPPLRPCPPIPTYWPEPVEHPECWSLWQKVCGKRPVGGARLYKFYRSAGRMASSALRAVSRK